MTPKPMKSIDLCPVGLAERNTLVSRRFAALGPGESLEVTVDSPPWVLYHQLRTDRFGEFEWRVLEQGPDKFVVRLTRRATA